MSVHLLIASTLKVTIAGRDHECQVTAAGIPGTPASQGTKVFTACPGGVATIPDPEAAADQLTLSWLHDWTDNGLSWALAQAAGTDVPFTLVMDPDKPTDAREYAGTLKVPARIPDEWAARAEQRATVTFDVTGLTGPTRHTAP